MDDTSLSHDSVQDSGNPDRAIVLQVGTEDILIVRRNNKVKMKGLFTAKTTSWYHSSSEHKLPWVINASQHSANLI